MGNRSTKSSLQEAIIYLNISADEISASDEKFWSKIFAEDANVADEIIKNITVQEIRMLRDGSPKNFATLSYKMVEQLLSATSNLCNTHGQQAAVLNAVKILIRTLPCIFEDRQWRCFFEQNLISLSEELRKQPELKYPLKSQSERNYEAYLPCRPGSRSTTLPGYARSYDNEDTPHYEAAKGVKLIKDIENQTVEGGEDRLLLEERLILMEPCELTNDDLGEAKAIYSQTPASISTNTLPNNNKSLMEALILSICDLLFCPEFTVLSHGDSYLANVVDNPPEDLKSLSTHDYVWEPGVGFDSNVNSTTHYDKNRSELLRALLVCLSVTLYETPKNSIKTKNNWMELFVSQANRHALPLFTSLLNVVFSYKPHRPILRLNTLIFESSREQLVELACQLLIATLDYNPAETTNINESGGGCCGNAFIDYMSRIHRDEDFVFIIKGFIRLLNANFVPGYLWMSSNKFVELDLELQVLLWRMCNLNKKFIQHLLRSSEILDIVVPILYHLNENFQEPSKTALIHIGVFNLLILSSERNFGVRLNKQYSNNLLNNLPEFSPGSHADLMILVFHKLIMYGYKINQLYDYILSVLVNVSPYLKGMTILASKCLIQLFETFSSVLVLFTEPNYHQIVIFLLEIFNNLIQYQFDGNANLVFMIIKKKELFLKLGNLSTSQKSIDKVFKKLLKQKQRIDQLGSEQQQNQRKTKTDKISDKYNYNQLSNNESSDEAESKGEEESDDLEISLATLSCTNKQLIQNSNTATKQEVSLVATPDLNQATHSVHPFDSCTEKVRAGVRPSSETKCCTTDDHGKKPKKPLNLDGILIETEDSCFIVTNEINSADSNVVESNSLKTQPSNFKVDLLTSSDLLIESHQSEPLSEPELVESKKGLTSEEVSSKVGSSNSSQIAPTKWRPTSNWLKEWKQSLPLQTVIRMISALEPQVEQLKKTSGCQLDEAEIIKFLQNGTLVGLLPVPHPIQIRKYHTNDLSTMWFRACTWGIIYVRSTTWTGTCIRLIKIL